MTRDREPPDDLYPHTNGDALGDDDLDAEFDLGDGTADTSAVVACPYCGEPNEITLDPGGGEAQDYVEDCQVCCQPWHVVVGYDAGGVASVSVERADD